MQKDIIIIQGDSWQHNLSLCDGMDTSLLKQVTLTCRALNLQQDYIYDEAKKEWYLSFSEKQTAKFKEVRTTYDITFTFLDDKVKTFIYCGNFYVYKKINKLRQPEVEDE